MLPYLLVLLHFGAASWGVYHALLYKRDPRAAMGWIMACIFIPYGGPVAYFLFGINRVRSRARGLQGRFLYVGYEAGARVARPSSQGQAGLRDAGWRITGRSLISGNSVTPLHNGDAAYPAMIEAIQRAQHRVLLCTYIFKLDRTGESFVTALEEAARRGVEVRVLIDGFGEKYAFRRVAKHLQARGIRTARFLPPRLLPPSIYLNLRNHRKILVADSSVAFAGGMNIDDHHTTLADAPREVTDVHFALRGPIVAELATLFGSDWHFATRGDKALPGAPPAQEDGDTGCRLIPDGPTEALDALAVAIQTAISAAQKSVDIMTPYFLPSRELMGALESAALRGVRVRIVLPGKNNLFYVHWANQNTLAELLRWEIEAYYQPPPFCHSKLLCIDDIYTLLGSANLDSRSLRLNFELGIEVFSEQLSAELRTHFDKTIAKSRRIGLEELKGRHLGLRLRDSAAALFSPYL